MWTYLLLAIMGLFIGGLGTLIGAGGGFLLMPALVLMYPHERPETLASISLAVVFFNALSGTAGYARQKRIHYPSGLLFVATGIPGAIGGALVTSMLPRSMFDLWLGGLLVIVSLVLLIAGSLRPIGKDDAAHSRTPRPSAKGGVFSFVVGFVSSLLGIGGGIIHVPGMVFLLGFPVHLAAGTSHFVLCFTAAAGTVAHIAGGEFHNGFRRTAALAVGVVIGAQIGAKLAKHTPASWILRVLALAIAGVGIRVVMQAVRGHP